MTDAPESSNVAEIIRAKLETLRAELSKLEAALEALEGKPKIYAGRRIHEAVEMYLKEVGSAGEEEIFQAIKEGGSNLGEREPMGHLRRSLTQSVNAGRLRTTEDGKYELAN